MPSVEDAERFSLLGRRERAVVTATVQINAIGASGTNGCVRGLTLGSAARERMAVIDCVGGFANSMLLSILVDVAKTVATLPTYERLSSTMLSEVLD